MKLSKYIDHTLLKADATKDQIVKLCQEAIENEFKTVCVNTSWISTCKKELENSDVGVCCVVGFPLGTMDTASKAFEASQAIKSGADEVDMVIHIGQLKDGNYEYLVNDIKAVKQSCEDKVLKVILETCLLTNEEKELACKACVEANADFVKTSTGFSKSGATLEDVVLMKKAVNGKCLVKAAGGVKTHTDLINMIEAGADRIGTSSGIALIQKKESEAGY